MKTMNKVSNQVIAFLIVLVMICGGIGLNGISIPANVAFADSGSSSTAEQSDSIYNTKTEEQSDLTYNIEEDVENIISGIRDTNDVHEPSYYSNDWVLGMAAAGLSLNDDEKEKYLTNVLNLVADSTTSIGTKAKTAIALTALNIDARQVANKNEGQAAIDLINEIESFDGYIDPAYAAPFILSLYDLSNYEISTSAAVTREKLIEVILKSQEPGGSWYGDYGSDATGMVLPALAPYYEATLETNGINIASCSAITAAVNDALDYLSRLQEIDGGFPGWEGTQNSNTMSTNIVGINALGLNSHTNERFIKGEKSAMQKLISYRTSDDKLYYDLHDTDNTFANDLACQQGLGALATYQNLYNERSSNLYHFTKEVVPHISWPNADLLTAIKIIAPTQTIYRYDAAKTNDTVNTEGMSVTAVYNGDLESVSSVALENCIISNIDRSKPGTQTVTVSYHGCTALFTVTVLKSDGIAPVEDTVSVTVKNNKTIASDNSLVIEDGKTSVMDVLKMLLDDAGISYVIKQNAYISEINGLGEFEQGSNSGWLYSVNGITPSTTSAKEYKLQDGDVVVVYYTLDFTVDKSTSNWKAGKTEIETGAPHQTAVIKVPSIVDDKGKAIAHVSTKEVTSALENNLKNAGEKSRVKVQIIVDGSDATSVEIVIPISSIKELSSKTDAVMIITPIADIGLDKDTLNTLVAVALGNIKITAGKLEVVDIKNINNEVKSEIGDRPVYDFSIMSNSNNISEFDGKIIITVPYIMSQQEKAEGLVIYFLNDNGSVEVVRDCIYDTEAETMTFTTRHFSNYVLAYKELNFTDVVSHWAKDEIAFLAARKIVNGISETTFLPNSNITRAQFVQILSNLAGNDTSDTFKDAVSSFIDVKETSWYARAVEWAAEEGIVKGIENKDGSRSFHPDTNISRQDMAVLISRFYEKDEEYRIAAIREEVVFQDKDRIAGYAADAVRQLQQAGLIEGKTLNTFVPTDHATRAESAKMIAMMIRNSLIEPDSISPKSDNNNSK